MNEQSMTNLTDVALITCVVKPSATDAILKAALEAGALTGAISYQARGHGARERLGLLGIAVEAEKDVVSLLVSSEQRDTVFDAVFRAGKLNVPGNGYQYITPLEKVATYIPQDMLKHLTESHPDT
ncbi:P-II family nitrogen regulator [Pseudomonadota bacterium]